MSLPEFGISLGGSVLLAILMLTVAVASALFFYRTTVPPAPRRTRVALASLRGFALALLLLLVFEPLLKLIFRSDQSPVVAILLDDSESMTIRDQAGDRLTRVRAVLERNHFGQVPARIAYYRFSGHLHPDPLSDPDSLTFGGETTDLAAALTDVGALRERENVQAIVIVTDGAYTVGKNPLAAADELGIPCYTIGVGDTAEHKDVMVARVTKNKIAYADTRVPVDVRLRSSGYKGLTVDVALSRAGVVTDHKLVQLSEGTHPVSLSYEPKEEGVQKYTVSVTSLRGELTERNNSHTFYINVLKSKLRILLLAGAPSPDVSMIRQILLEEKRFSVQERVQKSQGEFYTGTLAPALIDSTDCIVLIGYPSPAAMPIHIQHLRDAALRGKKPLLFVAARTLDFDKLRSLEELLPFTWSAPGLDEVSVFPHIAEKSRTHALVRLGERINTESWDQLPPVFKTQTVFRAKPEADVLASAKIQAIVLSEPLILVRNVAGMRSFAITGEGIWRWRLLAQGNPHTDQLLPLLITNAVRWLTAPDERKRVRVVPTKEAFTSAEPVEFTGEVYDDRLMPLDDAELAVEATAKGGNSKVETILRSIGSGRYEGTIAGLGPGDYSFSATATSGGAVVGKDKGRFSVGQLNVEFLETRMNKSLLEQLAFRTGGLYSDIEHVPLLVDSLRSRIPFTPRELVSTHEVELWNWQYIAGLIVLLLGTEWFVRKLWGML